MHRHRVTSHQMGCSARAGLLLYNQLLSLLISRPDERVATLVVLRWLWITSTSIMIEHRKSSSSSRLRRDTRQSGTMTCQNRPLMDVWNVQRSHTNTAYILETYPAEAEYSFVSVVTSTDSRPLRQNFKSFPVNGRHTMALCGTPLNPTVLLGTLLQRLCSIWGPYARYST